MVWLYVEKPRRNYQSRHERVTWFTFNRTGLMKMETQLDGINFKKRGHSPKIATGKSNIDLWKRGW